MPIYRIGRGYPKSVEAEGIMQILSNANKKERDMARGDQLARQWKIFQTLISSRRGKSVTDLAANLDCHKRTVYRDLEALQIAGFPLYDEKVNGKSLWCLLDTARKPMPIPFSLPELVALYFGRDAFKVLKDTVFYDSLESLFQKIKTTLPSQSRKYLSLIEKSLKVGPKPYKQYGKFREIIEQINEAVINRKIIEIVYFAMGRKKMTRREVAPYRLWYADGGFYLIGYCRWRKEIRIFAIDRIKKLRLTDEPFEVPDDFDVDELTKYSFGVFHDESVKVRVHFSADVAGYIKEKVWHASQRIEVLDDGSVIFEAEVAGTEEIKFWIMRWGSNAYVLEPEELREEIQSEAAGMLVMYENGIVQEKKTLTA